MARAMLGNIYNNMNAELKEAFTHIKPVCDIIMVCPTAENIGNFVSRVLELNKEAVESLQQYLMFPLITHIKSVEIERNYELQSRIADAMTAVLDRVMVKSPEMCMKVETGLLHLIFDNSKPGMIADVPEELKHSVMKCLTVLMLHLENKPREMLLKTQVPLLAQAIFVSVHIAKLERLRALRLAAINCVTAHTMTHAQLTKDYHITDRALELIVVDTLASILPGVLAALQDVATCADNPGHAVVVAAIDAIHRTLCVTMQDKLLLIRHNLTADDFTRMITLKMTMKQQAKTEVSSKGKSKKHLPKRSPEWYSMAGDKLLLITNSLASLRTHEHYKVRKELAVYCSRILIECNVTMQPSIPVVLDILMSLAKDEYPEVAEYCANSVKTYFANASCDGKTATMDTLCENFFATLTSLPRIMNNIDSSRKLSSLNLVHGYLQTLGPRLAAAAARPPLARKLCAALADTAQLHTHLALLTRHAQRDVKSQPAAGAPWAQPRLLDSRACEAGFQDICRLLGAAQYADLLLDTLMERFHHGRDCEIVYIMNWMASAPNSSLNMVQRILEEYIEESVWYSSLEVGSAEPPLSELDTRDVSVYNPRAWTTDSVPDLYEGAVETRYTDISYRSPRTRRPPPATAAQAQRNMLLSCLLAQGVGQAALRMGPAYQPYLLRTLCLILERVGSKYEMLHLAGLKAINDIATGCEYASVTELIKCNADYITNQVTVRLKKVWNCQSALQILSVVMEYSDSTILNYLYGIVEDVLVQSCDKYYEKDLQAYLQVFLTFVECIRKWYLLPKYTDTSNQPDNQLDILNDVKEFIACKEEEERLMNEKEMEKDSEKSAEDMYKEDMKKREEDVLDYDDTVTEEKPPLPQHVTVTITILKRCLNYVVSSQRDDSIMALQILNQGLPVLGMYEDELLPMVHLTWAPLVAKFEDGEPTVMISAFELLVTMAELSKDFIRSRAMKEVLPHVYKFLHKSSLDSHLKDVGSAYRNSRAFRLQAAALAALPPLLLRLAAPHHQLAAAMACLDPYLSNKQPKPLQSLAVEFFKTMLDYDYGAAWYHLREVCDNDLILPAPCIEGVYLEPIVGTPFQSSDKDYEDNIKLIFEHMSS